MLDAIAQPTSPLATVPTAIARTARYVEPVLIAYVEYREFTGDEVLRHPGFRGLRHDRSPAEVVLPTR